MDAQTAFLIAMLMMLANGGVLGLMHRDFPIALRPSAVSWRVATLLIAGACALFAFQRSLAAGLVLPLANGMIILGLTGYWRALRQFYGQPDSWLLLVPVCIGTFCVFLFTVVWPALLVRILLVSIVWIVIISGSIYTLYSQEQRDAASSRRVMIGIFVVDFLFILARAIYYLTLSGNPGANLLDNTNLMNVFSPMIVATLPVIGTTAFLLLCSERIRRQWERAASTDYLTGLANRRTLTDVGESRFALCRQKGEGLALAVIDIDRFKSINDRFGHDIGDSALKHVAACLLTACRERELPARQGGEEFVVLFHDVDMSQALLAGERLRSAVKAEAFCAREEMLTLTVSIGVAVIKDDDCDFDHLLRRADEALYAAKAAGRDRVELAA